MSGARKFERARRPEDKQGIPLAQRAYSAVREAIDSGQLAPGERVSEYHVASWLNISRTPAREALQRLEAEGLLHHQVRRGLVVVTIDEEALRELYTAREVVESALARLAAENGSGPQLNAIRHAAELEPTLIDDREAMYRHNREFHELIYRAAHNSYLSKACISMHDVIATDGRGSNLAYTDRRHAIVEEHRAMALAIAERRADDAASAAAAHIRSAFEARTAGERRS